MSAIDVQRQALPMAVVVGQFPSLSETFILSELEAMAAAGLDPSVFALHQSAAPVMHARAKAWLPAIRFVPPAASPAGVSAAWRRLAQGHRARALHWLWWLLRTGCRFPRMLIRCIRHLPAIAALGVAGRDRQIGYMHAHFATLPAEIVWAAARYNRCSFGVSTHAHDVFTQSPALLRFKLREASVITGCTATHVRYLKALATPAMRARVTLVYHGVTMPRDEPLPPPGVGPTILAVGRLVRKKAFDVLIDAVAGLAARQPDVDCNLIGEGPERARLQQRIRGLGLDGRVHLRGAYTQEDMPAAWRAATLVVVPARTMPDGDRDGIPNVLLEAMARGIAVIATDTASVREVVCHGINGWLVPGEDPAALTDAIIGLLQDPSLRARLGELGAVTVRRDFDATDHARRWTDRLAVLTGRVRETNGIQDE